MQQNLIIVNIKIKDMKNIQLKSWKSLRDKPLKVKTILYFFWRIELDNNLFFQLWGISFEGSTLQIPIH